MSMYRKCLVCDHEFARNEALEHLDRGRRVAYDPARGRLWLICGSCSRWSLVPMESRWEALEELEKLVRDGARVLSRTDNVALMRAGHVEIVRVGEAQLREEAWWRYGRELRQRRERFRKLSKAGAVGAAAAIAGGWATGGITFVSAWLLWNKVPEAVTGGARWLRFGSTAWRGRGECVRCGHPIDRVRYVRRGGLVLTAEEASPGLTVSCPICDGSRDSGLPLAGAEAERTLRRVLAYHHFAGASDRRVENAVGLIEASGGPERLPSRILKRNRAFAEVGRIGRVAIEIALHQESERRLLAMELAELEAHWRREEELAAIMDGELTPLPLLDSLRRRIVGVRASPARADQ